MAKATREKAANEVTDAFKAAAKAKREAIEKLEKFTDKYGSFHQSFSGRDAEDFFETPFDFLFSHFLNY